ncbi:MAG: hypothetical protein WC699_00795 [Bacteroidales bacterium]|jgi:archaellum component FlaF (FlaF/FlaG flagellin family)
MKKQIYLLAMAAMIAIPFSSCKKSDPPVVTTATVSSITETGAKSGGDITDEGTSAVTARGVCWGTAANPTVADSKTTDGTGTGVFTSTISGLTPGTLYHLRAYATNTEGTGYGEDVTFSTASLLKTIGVVYSDGVEKYEFIYDGTTKRISRIDDFWNDELDKTITYDYSVSGKLTITKGSSATTYDINTNGMVTKEDWGGGEYAAYEYDADGYLVKIIEHWGGADHLKMQAVITNGNVMKHTTYDDDGVTVKKIKEFTYTTGENVNNIQQANMVDSNTLPCGNLFGKASKKLVDYLEYWDPRNTDPKKRTTITYEFDAKNRPSKITRTGVDFVEVYTYTYYE